MPNDMLTLVIIRLILIFAKDKRIPKVSLLSWSAIALMFRFDVGFDFLG